MISLIAPSGPINAELLQSGIRLLHSKSLEITTPIENVLSQTYLFSGTTQVRLDQLIHALEFPQIIWCARGGTGCNELLPAVTRWLKHNTPKAKAFIGLSDPTPLMNILASHMPVIYGPMVATEDFLHLTEDRWAWLLHLLHSESDTHTPFTLKEPLTFFKGVQMAGKVVGGTLAMLTSVMGTPYDTTFDNKIVFLEDVHEPDYRLVRHFTQLIQGNKLAHIKGLILGSFTTRGPTKYADMTPMLNYLFAKSDFPIIQNFPLGHCENPLALPLNRMLRITESEVCLL